MSSALAAGIGDESTPQRPGTAATLSKIYRPGAWIFLANLMRFDPGTGTLSDPTLLEIPKAFRRALVQQPLLVQITYRHDISWCLRFG